MSESLFHEWMRLTPADLDAAVARRPVAYLPVGSLEWHGPHLPAGTDTYRAEAVCRGVGERVGGVLLPPLYTTSPGFPLYRGSMFFSARLVIDLMKEMRRELRKAGFRVLVQALGHSGAMQVHSFEGAFAEADDGLIVVTDALSVPPESREALGLGGAHAGSAETAQTMGAAPPGTIHLDRYDPSDTALPRYEADFDTSVYADGLPADLRERTAMTLARREWPNYEEDLVARVSPEGRAEAALAATVDALERKVREAVARLEG